MASIDESAREAIQPGLHAGRVELAVEAYDARLLLTDRRLIVTDGKHVRLDIEYADVRHVELDLEHGGSAVLFIVPHRVRDYPQVLPLPRAQLHKAGEVLAFIGERLP